MAQMDKTHRATKTGRTALLAQIVLVQGVSVSRQEVCGGKFTLQVSFLRMKCALRIDHFNPVGGFYVPAT